MPEILLRTVRRDGADPSDGSLQTPTTTRAVSPQEIIEVFFTGPFLLQAARFVRPSKAAINSYIFSP
jgi:hypothetical protein